MQLFYYQDVIGNFGDDLNPWIFYSLCPEVFNGEGPYLTGIGTIINSKAPKGVKKVAFGSGVGYHGRIDVSDQWEFMFVRGPLSAAALGLQGAQAWITDPAILLVELVRPHPLRDLITYMPHHLSAINGDWRSICQQLGITYLDPTGEMHHNLHLINRSKLVLADAMHAAIAADALRVPWVAIKSYDHILDFKWDDWCQSLDMAYHPNVLPEFWTVSETLPVVQQRKDQIKRVLLQCGFKGQHWTPPYPLSNRVEVEDQVMDRLRRIVDHVEPSLSSDEVHQQRLDAVCHQLEILKQRFA